MFNLLLGETNAAPNFVVGAAGEEYGGMLKNTGIAIARTYEMRCKIAAEMAKRIQQRPCTPDSWPVTYNPLCGGNFVYPGIAFRKN